MSDYNINKMDFKQLRNEVQLLRDELAIFKRKYEDVIYNLDDDNFSGRFIKEKGDMKTSIKVTAEGVNSIVSKNISAKFESSEKPTYGNTTVAQKGMLCEYKGDLYYFSDITETWKIYPYADGIMSQFLQTASGFELTGDVEISGDAIVGGVVTGASFQDANRNARLCLGDDNGAKVGDLSLIRNSTDSEIFSIYDAITYVKLNLMDKTILHTADNTTYPQGTWNFTECDVEGLGSSAATFG